MAKGHKAGYDPTAAVGDGPATATAELPPPADPQPNGEQPVPQPATAPKRRPRDPNAPRPLYFLLAANRTTGVVRVIGTAPTIGQARKQVPNMAYSIREGETGPMIGRVKLVA